MRNSSSGAGLSAAPKGFFTKIKMKKQEEHNRYFSIESLTDHPRPFFTVTPAQAERAKADPRFSEAADPVRTYAYFELSELYGEEVLYSFREHPPEEGDRMLIMQQMLRS